MTEQGSSVNRYLIFVIFLLVILSLALTIALIAMNSSKHDTFKDNSKQQCNCRLVKEKQIFLDEEPNIPPVFHDLTKSEIRSIQKYLYEDSDLNLVKPSANKTNASYVFTIELYLPDKSDVLMYLDENGPKPTRMARVTIIRENFQNPEINEIIVEPLPNPSSHRPVPGKPESIRFINRPISNEEYYSAVNYVNNEVDSKAGEFIQAAFGTGLKNCGDRCLDFLYISSFSPASSGDNKRKMWFWLHYTVEYFLLHPVDFSVLTTSDQSSLSIESVWYSGRIFDSLESLMHQYRQNKLPLNISTFPQGDSFQFSKLTRRGKAPDLSYKRDPVQIYPDGQRYTIKHRHIEYMDWSFDFRLSTSYGPQIYDVRFRGKRIAYEIGLQEISVYYSGNSPQQRFSDFIDSVEVFGPTAKGLIPGVDCPELSTFVNAYHIETSFDPAEVMNAFCVFEWNTGEPLRRHYSKSTYGWKLFRRTTNICSYLENHTDNFKL
ncbi:hypothetical protein FSP39_001420 [Pinctada imbricata]|uniref:Amine oxidase n=1 Tax=Pinctada imbricata TaxID=66713 RepID=A0AA88XIW2_PINIB|nr:hypothetical protein FSP39_001420 [Pinctada imbricata]